MRIVAGTLGGRRIRAPRGPGTRPTPERVREAVFSVLGPLGGLRVLDLFAGSGALGIEALSRGAVWATLVDRSPAAHEAMRRNVTDLGLSARCRVRRASWGAALRAESDGEIRYDIIFLDPPYGLWPELAGPIVPALEGVAAPGARVVAEHPASRAPSLRGMRVERSRVYGDTGVTLLTLESG